MTAKAKPKAQAKATKPKTKAKAQTPPPTLIPQRIQTEHIAPLIHWIRGAKVMLDRELAALYGVETRTLKQAVRRNQHRFPDDFMFPLTQEEIEFMVSQNVIPHKKTLGGASPLAFTEQGVAMLSSVLRSHRAVEVNLAIMRTFVQLRKLMDNNQNLSRKINNLEKKYDEQFTAVFHAIKQLLAEDKARKRQQKRQIGFHTIR